MAPRLMVCCYSSVNILTLLLYILCSTWSENEATMTGETSLDIAYGKYDSSWAVELQYFGKESDIRMIASTLGLGYRQILSNNYYLLTDENSPDPSDEPNVKITEALKSFPQVLWVEQQMVHENDVRDTFIPLDPLWEFQEYLKSKPIGFTINHHVQDVWNKGYTGNNVTVAVIDDGVRGTHNEFEHRYDFNVSFEIAKGDTASKAIHGTKCAGVIAAGDSNGLCGIGVAFNATIAGIRLFSSFSSTDAQEAEAFYKDNVTDKVDIFSSSWGPKDSGHSVRAPRRLASNALKKGTKQGRNGLGSIYLFSAGNGGQFGDSCAFDGYVNDIHTISVTSVTKDGNLAPHVEACSAVMTAVYSHDMVTPSSKSDTECVSDFGRTSAASAFLAGILALTLEANPNITWRDVQHLIARSSTWSGVHNDVERFTNGKNFTVGEYFGFGVLDALILVEKARNWTVSVPEQLICTVDIMSNGESRSIPDLFTKNITQKNLNCQSNKSIRSLEHVQLTVDLNFTNRAVLTVYVKSPSGTNSKLIYSRLWDSITGRKSYNDLTVTSLHFWGEPVVGEWTVNITEHIKSANAQREGTLFNLTLKFYGTSEVIDWNNQITGKTCGICSGKETCKILPSHNVSCSCNDYEIYYDGNTCKENTGIKVEIPLDQSFSKALTNISSPAYVKLKKNVTAELTKAFKDTTNFQELVVLRFRSGSVIVEFTVIYRKDPKVNAKEVVAETLKKEIVEGKIGNLKVIVTGVKIQGTPPPPKSLKETDVTKNSIDISWREPTGINFFTLNGYTVSYKPKSESRNKTQRLNDSSKLNLVLKNLESDTLYEITVHGYNEEGDGEKVKLEVKTDKSFLILIVVIVVVGVSTVPVTVGVYFVIKKRSIRHRQSSPEIPELHGRSKEPHSLTKDVKYAHENILVNEDLAYSAHKL